ncbi:MAG: 2-oxoacid:acceptor oxidoreductase family protein [Oscillospiraceae bacterium]|nr:2-oxoacid:acceptor oxidoreductase family protein [Oscillospiraceae bacterium]
MTSEIILAGFGGQGILFAGKVLAYCALAAEKELSWLPSYGPEMRGGTANCSVCISDKPIGSPLVLNPNLLIAMNLPSYAKFIGAVQPGGKAFIDSTLIDEKTDRTDIEAFYVPATQLASDNNLSGMANIILLGKLIKETGLFDLELIRKGLEKCIPPKKANLIDSNMKAIEIGFNF